MSGNPALAKTAVESLAGLPGKEVDAEIVARLSKAEGKMRLVLLQLVGDRMLTAAMPEVIKASSDPDLQIRLQALATLGDAVEFKDLSVLIDRVAAMPAKAEEAKAAEAALKTACQRMPDADACAAKVVAAMGAAKVPARIESPGGARRSGRQEGPGCRRRGGRRPQRRHSGRRQPSVGQVDDVGRGSGAGESGKVGSRCEVRRCVRSGPTSAWFGSFPCLPQKRAEMCRTAMAIAKRDAEKKLVLDVLTRYPSLEGLPLAAEAAKTASLKPDATKAVLAIAQKIGGNSPQIQQTLAQLGHKQVKIEILGADMALEKKWKDVTDLVRQSVHGLPLLDPEASIYNAGLRRRSGPRRGEGVEGRVFVSTAREARRPSPRTPRSSCRPRRQSSGEEGNLLLLAREV